MSNQIKTRHNWKSDLEYHEGFYLRKDDGTLEPVAIPPDEIDIRITYIASCGKFTASRIKGEYLNCKKIDAFTLAVYIPLSRHFLGDGMLVRELVVTTPHTEFEDGVQNICTPYKTGVWLWDGPTDGMGVIQGQIVIGSTFRNTVIDLTQPNVQQDLKMLVAALDAGETMRVSLKVNDTIPIRAVTQIEDKDDSYILYTGVLEGETGDGHAELNQLCYVLNKLTGAIRDEWHKLLHDLATALELDTYLKKSDQLIISCGNSEI